MKVATWNVNGIRAREQQVRQWIEAERPDVVCLQELRAPCSKVPQACRELAGYTGVWHGGERAYSGVALLVREDSLAPSFWHPEWDWDARAVAATAGALEILSLYVPNGGRDFPGKLRFLQALRAHAAEARATGKALLVCGDLNVARSERDVHPKERRPVVGQLPVERDLFAAILEEGQLVDVARALHPDDDGLFTWWAPWRRMRERNIGWRLDYILAGERLAASARSCAVQRDFGSSDHGPVVAELG